MWSPTHIAFSAAAVLALAPGVMPCKPTTCAALKSKIEMVRSNQPEYAVEQADYWSTSCGALKPSCILYPHSADEVVEIIKTLNLHNETFAIKSGGHNPNLHFSSVHGGPLIATDRLNEVVFDRETETVRIGPGNRWVDVAKKLDALGYGVPGGRVGDVGVGGYLLGGGLSFMSTEVGWGVNSLVEADLVLPNGTFVTVSKDQHPDIFASLKAGGNMFGVVTTYVIQAYPMDSIWGGTIMYPSTNEIDAALFQATRDFAEHYPDDKAAVIVTTQDIPPEIMEVGKIWTVFLYYNGETPPEGMFNNFTRIPSIANTCQTRKYGDLLEANNKNVIKTMIYTMGTETIPVPNSEHSAEILGAIHSLWQEHCNSVKHVPAMFCNYGYQPIPKRLARVAREKGGDMYDLDDDVDRFFMVINFSWLGEEFWPEVDAAMQGFYTSIRELVLDSQAQGKLPEAYLPLFMNDCYQKQDYFARLRPEKVAVAREVADSLDPEGIWRSRHGGFRA